MAKLKDPIKITGITTRTTIENSGREIAIHIKEDIPLKISNKRALGAYYGISIDFKDGATRRPPSAWLNRHLIQHNQTEGV